ncbi:MAG: radical SAM protein [Planctomycetes bacterium]|nr:radical SAM protein [Planctomycetota bacterium]
MVFGPVPSRRLGRSLGINNIPPKNCSYSCVYCQLGRTRTWSTVRREYYRPSQLVVAVQERLLECRNQGEPVDYLTFVPDGEPTLDLNLGHAIRELKQFGIPIAVITNASLLWQDSVRGDLAAADFVSMKLDSADADVWRKINCPDAGLDFATVIEGMERFAAEFDGTLVTETMLVRDLNDSRDQLEKTAELASRLGPQVAYLAVPTRPPAEPDVRPPDSETLLRAMEIFGARIEEVEYLIGYEGNAFASSGDIRHDLLSITAVHPLREDALRALLQKTRADAAVVQSMVDRGELLELSHEGHKYYLRRFASPGTALAGALPSTCN